jgi:hypothetical protein
MLMTPEPDQAGSIPADDPDERQLCVNCVAPNQPSAHFCADCGAPLSSYAATGPFELVFAEGHVYRQAAEHPRHLIVVLGVWLIFTPMAFTGVWLMLDPRESSVADVLLGLLFFAVSLAMISKTTRNYVTPKPAVDSHED